MSARFLFTTCLLAAGCSAKVGTADDSDLAPAPVNICGETVPDTNYVDGLPAYAQCADSEESAIYSDDGVNTATTAVDATWVMTQGAYGYQCTELAERYLVFHWGITWEPNGDAGSWCDADPPADSGLVLASTPSHGDIMVFPPGACGADPTYGHVAVVDTVDSDTSITVVEQNVSARAPVQTSCAACFLHATGSD